MELSFSKNESLAAFQGVEMGNKAETTIDTTYATP